MTRKIFYKELFIKNATEKHGNKYDYLLVDYVTNKIKVKIICPRHGIFEQAPNDHLKGRGCKGCFVDSRKLTTNKFIQKAKEVHGELYNYSESIYLNNHTKIKIICSEHGEFEQTPANHLSNHKCIYCAGLNKKTTDKFITEAKVIHGDKYDYSLVNYIGSKSNVTIKCFEHGEFKQAAISHLSGAICPKCSISEQRKTTEEFIIEAKLIHNEKYNYDNTIYITSKLKVIISCDKHGIFKQNPRLHLEGKGCPICKESKGEREIRNYLNNIGVKFEVQKRYSDCKNIHTLPFDVYVPSINTCIEYNGRQHYRPIKVFGGDKGFELTQKRDKIKMEYCRDNNIPLCIIRYDEDIIKVLDKLFNWVTTIN